MLEEMKSGRRRSLDQNMRRPPPFALDFEDLNESNDDNLSMGSHSLQANSCSSWDSMSRSGSFRSTGTPGYRAGGPKEARLRRVALLSKAKEVDHMVSIKVMNIPTRQSSPDRLLEDEIREQFQKFGPVGDVYLPIDYKNGQPKRDFAIVRYEDPSAVERATSPETHNSLRLNGQRVIATPLSRQESFFSGGTGYLGISNEPCGQRDPPPELPE